MADKGRLSLFVFIDALGWELTEKYGFMEETLTSRRPLETIFGYSSTCDPTILTGKMPREHGHFAFYYYSPETSPFRNYRWLGLLPGSLMNRGRVRNKLSQFVKRQQGFTGYFQLYNMPFRDLHLFDYSERKNIFEPGGINGGQPIIFEALEKRNLSYVVVNDYRSTEEECLLRLEDGLRGGRTVMAYVYLPKLDALLHQHGSEGSAVEAHVRWYEERLRSTLEKLRSDYDSVRLFMFSDHGMTDIHSTCDLIARVDDLGLTFGEDYAAVYDSTMARFWFIKEGSRETIEAALAEEPKGHIMPEKELAAYGCDFPDGKYGDLFFLMKPGVLLCPSFMGVKPLAGMHGYAPADKDSTAALLSNVALDAPPKRLDDLYGLMLEEAIANAAG